jgi:hypothetical protein
MPALITTIEAKQLTPIDENIREAMEIAKRQNCAVKLQFPGFTNVITPSTTFEEAYRRHFPNGKLPPDYIR